jgi:hypothetical protein
MKKSEAFKILDLADGASDEDVKKAHRQKVRENHPDRFTDPGRKKTAEDRTKLINEARDVLLSRKWDPEYGSRGGSYANPYANPYGNPYTSSRPAGNGSGSGGGQGQNRGQGQEDPFAGWPFDYVWTSWDNVGSEGRGNTDPFRSAYTSAPKKTAAQEADEAKRSLNFTLAAFAGKCITLLGCWLAGDLAIGLFIYILATILLSLYQEARGCSGLTFIPLLVFFGPVIALFVPRPGATVSAYMMLFFALAVAYDIGAIRKAAARYNTAKERAKVSQ